jgi:hypothetical protein
MKKVIILGTLLLTGAGSVLAGANPGLDFDVANSSVSNLTQGGDVEVTTLTKVEALEDGVILSETAFFHPATAERIVSTLSEEAGISGLSAFATGVTRTGPTEDGQGWKGEMSINLDNIRNSVVRDLWTPEFVEKIKNVQEKEYKLNFELRTSTAGEVTTINFKLLDGRVFQKLEVEARVFAGGSASTLVVVRARTKSSISPDVGERVLVAKKIMRAAPKLLNRSLGQSK